MKFYAICVIKNEVDIIDYTLKQASKWADRIIVFDNGSTDGTWEKVCKLKNEIILPYLSDDRPYSDGLRAIVFDDFKHELKHGDWWVILDGDEEYVDDPRIFVSNQKGYFHHINGKKVDFCFDLSKIDELNFDAEFSQNKELFQFYTPEAWSEPRMIKHREALKWEEKKIWPRPMGIVCSNAICIKHYPLRSKNQMMDRWKVRKSSIAKGGQKFNHWETEDWRKYYSWKMKDLQYAEPKSNIFLDVPFANNYKQPIAKRLAKEVLHRLGILP